MVSGTLPNDIPSQNGNYVKNAMGNLTFSSYNSLVSSRTGLGQNVIINETTPVFFQTDPYHLRVSYVENVALNVTGAMYRYSIPVNASIALNNTPDLFYAQQGVLRTVKFASLGNLTSQIGGVYAASGNSVGYAYGTVYNIPSNAVISAVCPPAPAPFSSAPMSGNLIIATYNSVSLGGCIGNYAGLITYLPPTMPAMPYLFYLPATGILSSLPSGMKVLLYGPGMDTLNVEGLRNAVMNGQYFASPFTPSYIDRSGANFLNQSPNGIFTFSNYGTQTGGFNGVSSYVDVGTGTSMNFGTGNFAIDIWVETTDTSTATWEGIVGRYDASNGGYWLQYTPSTGAWAFGWDGSTYLALSKLIGNGGWHHVVGVRTGLSSASLYIDGALIGSSSSLPVHASDGTTQLSIGRLSSSTGRYFNGIISNVQLYGTALQPSQIQTLYQEGISGLPISGNSLAGWWPLNGNANDLSGNNNNGVPTNVVYALPSNYVRDSILVAATPVKTQPIPGVISCTSNSRCSSNSLPNIYLSYMPLEVQNGFSQIGNFNGQTS